MELQHQIVLPNDTSFYTWEADLLTINRSNYVNEFECKISLADFKRDEKKDKFYHFQRNDAGSPNYFWYATLDFDITPPDFAGWLKISYDDRRLRYITQVMKVAPLRHKEKAREHKIKIAARLLSFKLMGFYDPYTKSGVK